jgi:uncharacterized protein with PIN domain
VIDAPRIKLFTDEHVHSGLAATLRQRGYDVVGCHEMRRGNQGIADESQLIYATEHGRALLTNDLEDFARLDQSWKVSGRRHAGIILYTRIATFSELLRCVERHLATTEPQVQYDTLLWLA